MIESGLVLISLSHHVKGSLKRNGVYQIMSLWLQSETNLLGFLYPPKRGKNDSFKLFKYQIWFKWYFRHVSESVELEVKMELK